MSIHLSWNVKLHMHAYADRKPQETEVSFFFGRSVEDQEIDNWQIGLESLALAVNHGALCGDQIAPGQSALKPLGVEKIGDEGVRLQFEIAGIDPGGWRVIAGLMVMSTYGAENPVVEISSAREKGRTVIKDTQVWDLAYPAIPSQLPFSLQRDEPSPSSYDVLLQIRFHKDLTEAQAEEVVSALSAWSSTLFGGYAEDETDLLDCSTDSHEVYMVDPRTVEYAAAYTGSEAGLDAAVMMALWFHENLAAVESMTIE